MPDSDGKYTMQEVTVIALEARNLIRQYPSAVYQKPAGTHDCSYTKGRAGEGTGCLLGQAIVKCGLPLPDGNDTIDTYIADEALERDLAWWLVTLQKAQDDRLPWDECLRLTEGNQGELDTIVRKQNPALTLGDE